MAKTEETLKLEHYIWVSTQKTGTFGCFEVTIGFGGRERVDYMTVMTPRGPGILSLRYA